VTASRPIRADAARNRDAIIAAARAAFDRGEFDRRFDDFAPLAGVGTGTLYRHFPTREALAEAVYRGEVAALRDRARNALDTEPPAQALATFLTGYVHLLTTEAGLAATLSVLLQHRPDVQAEGALALEAAVAELVAAAVNDGGVPAELTAGAVLMALHGISASVGRPGWEADAEGLVAVIGRPSPTA